MVKVNCYQNCFKMNFDVISFLLHLWERERVREISFSSTRGESQLCVHMHVRCVNWIKKGFVKKNSIQHCCGLLHHLQLYFQLISFNFDFLFISFYILFCLFLNGASFCPLILSSIMNVAAAATKMLKMSKYSTAASHSCNCAVRDKCFKLELIFFSFIQPCE